MSLVNIFLCATNQAKVFTLNGTFNFQINLTEWKGIDSDNLNKVWKKDFTKNKPKEDSAHAHAYGIDVDKCTWV